MENKYGASAHYQGEQGQAYFEYQNRSASIGAKLNIRKISSLVRQSDRLLDFGCGGGWLLRELDCTVKMGVELNESAHEICQSNNIEVYKTISDLPDCLFDVIITHHCLEHVPCPIEALRELFGVLDTGGKLIIIVPIDDWRVQRDQTGSDIDHHLHTWTPRLMANTLVEAGFRPIHISVLTHAWFPKWDVLYGRIPDVCFDMLCTIWSVVRRRRQILAYAEKA